MFGYISRSISVFNIYFTVFLSILLSLLYVCFHTSTQQTSLPSLRDLLASLKIYIHMLNVHKYRPVVYGIYIQYVLGVYA